MCRITNGFSAYGGTFQDDGETDCQTEKLLHDSESPELGVLCISAVKSSVNSPVWAIKKYHRLTNVCITNAVSMTITIPKAPNTNHTIAAERPKNERRRPR